MVVVKVVYKKVEMEKKWWWRRWSLGEQRKQEKELSLGGFTVGCRKQGRRREVKMKRERRRRGIYRIRIEKVMQINKGEGVFVKLRG